MPYILYRLNKTGRSNCFRVKLEMKRRRLCYWRRNSWSSIRSWLWLKVISLVKRLHTTSNCRTKSIRDCCGDTILSKGGWKQGWWIVCIEWEMFSWITKFKRHMNSHHRKSEVIYELSKVLCVLELLFMKDLVLLRLKKIILMILLQAVMMLMKLFRELSVAFRKDTGLADVNENYSKDTPHDKERK